MLKRYLVFYGPEYYPGGGWNDFTASFDLICEAREHVSAAKKDWSQIVDSHTGREIIEHDNDGPGESVDEQFSDEPLPPAEAEEVARLREKIATVRPPPAPGLSAVTVARAFEVMLPKHPGRLSLQHNPHKDYEPGDYEPALTWARNFEFDFISAVEQQKIEAVGEMWVLHWADEGGREIRLATASLPALAQWLEDNGLAFGS